jgi:hypothetical protein
LRGAREGERKNPKMETKTEGENGNNRMGNGRREKLGKSKPLKGETFQNVLEPNPRVKPKPKRKIKSKKGKKKSPKTKTISSKKNKNFNRNVLK